MDIDAAFALAVRREIDRQRVGVSWLAVASGIPERTLRRILHAQQNVKLTHVCAIAQALGVGCADIVGRADAMVDH